MEEHCKLRERRNTRASGQGTQNAESQGPGSVRVRVSLHELRASVWRMSTVERRWGEYLDVWWNRIKGETDL